MWLEDERQYSVSSRTQRLAAVRSFLKYASEKDKTVMALYLDIEGIPEKEKQEGNAVIEQITKKENKPF